MATLKVLETRKKSSTKLSKNSKLFKAVISAIQDMKGENIVSLDLRKVHESVADFFIVCSATSTVQIRAIGHNIEQKVEEICGEKPYKHEGYQSLQWVLIDYVNVVVHIMQPATRKFYQLEENWSDATSEGHDL